MSTREFPPIPQRPLTFERFMEQTREQKRSGKRLDEVHRILVWERLKHLTPLTSGVEGLFEDLYSMDGKQYKVTWKAGSFEELPEVIEELF